MKKIVFLIICILVVFSMVACDSGTPSNIVENTNTDSTPPELELKEDTITLSLNEEVNFLDYVSALDNKDGDITANIIILNNDVNFGESGEYSVVFQATDSSDNSSVIKMSVNVLPFEKELLNQAITSIKNEMKNPSSFVITELLYGSPQPVTEDVAFSNDPPYLPLFKIAYTASNDLGGDIDFYRYILVYNDGSFYITATDKDKDVKLSDYEESNSEIKLYNGYWSKSYEKNAQPIDAGSFS